MTAPITQSGSRRRYKRPNDRWDSLRARIQEHALLLVNQGDLVLKQIDAKHYWYLRFHLPADGRGHRRYRSLYVGRECDQELVVGRVRGLLEGFRQPRRQIEEIAGYVRVVTAMTRALRGASRHVPAKQRPTPGNLG